MSRALSLRRLGPATAYASEALGLLALFLAPEVEKPMFAVPAALALGASLTRVRLRDRLLLLLVAFCVLAGYATAMHEPTGTVLARALLPAHALLWLARRENVYRFWRLGIALVELVLAAILAPEAHMFVLIFFFVAIGSLALALGFIEGHFRAREVDLLDRPLRPSFVAAVLALSCVIFLSSLAIFPLLPRAHWAGDNATTTGYNEVVSFREGVLSWARQDSTPAAWIFRAPGQSWERIVPFSLLRGQVLENFSGDAWRAGTWHPNTYGVNLAGPSESFEILRQPMASDALLVPYGTRDVNSEAATSQSTEGEWAASGVRARAEKYKVTVGAFHVEDLGHAPSAAAAHFDAHRFPEIARLAEKLGAGVRADEERVRRVESYFRDGGYRFELGPVKAAVAGQRHPVEEFLFGSKVGHCELFAAGTALLFRALGMPARLVVGFRVRAPGHGDVLTVRSADAHAWVEVWQENRGWRPVDTTPAGAVEPSWLADGVGELYDAVAAYWHRYIVDYDFDSFSFRGWLKDFAFAGGALLLLLALGRGAVRRFRQRRDPREKLARVFAQFEDQLLEIAGVYPQTAFREIGEASRWLHRYQELRFGRALPTLAEVREMKREARQIAVRAAQELKAAN